MKYSIKNVLLILGALISISYFSSLNGSYHFDDSHSVEGNLAIRSLTNLLSFWTDPKTSSFIPENRVYRPLVYTFYSICWALGKGDTVPFHLMKIFFHLMVCLAIFLIWDKIWRIPGWFPKEVVKFRLPLFSKYFVLDSSTTALLIASLFAVHPACSECVDYISATTSLQCAMFYVWAFYFYLIFKDTKRSHNAWLAGLFYFFSVASKEEGITFPAVVFLSELLLSESAFKIQKSYLLYAFKRALPYVGIAVLLAGWIYLMHPTEGNESRGYSGNFDYFITQWRAYLWYMRLWFWPWDFNADSASLTLSTSIMDPLVIQGFIGNLFLLALGWKLRKQYPSFLFGLIWFYVTISPASSVVVLAELVNEHRMYLAYVGFVGGVMTLILPLMAQLFSVDQDQRYLGYTMTAIFLGLFVGTQERNRVWANDENLWLDTVEKNPTSGRALNNLALVYMGRGEHQKAIDYYEKCEVHWSTYLFCPLNKAISFLALGDGFKNSGNMDEANKLYDKAEKSLFKAYDLNPRSVHTNFQLGTYFENYKKDYNKAYEYFYKASEVTGFRYPDAELHIANCKRNLKQVDEAIAALQRALQVDPTNQAVLFEKGKIEYEVNRIPSSVETYSNLIQIAPSHLQGLYNYGLAEAAAQHLESALKLFEKVVAIDPKSKEGWSNLAVTAEKLGNLKRAYQAFKTLNQLEPGNNYYLGRMNELKAKVGEST